MPGSVFIKAFFRSPIKAVITFLLLAAVTFFFVFNLSAFAAQQKTAKQVEESTFGVLTAEYGAAKKKAEPAWCVCWLSQQQLYWW